MIYRGPRLSRRRMMRLLPHSQSSCVSPEEVFDGGRGGWDGGAKSYDGEKAWSSINYSILPAWAPVPISGLTLG
jgi:hypothetical protein